MKKALLVFVAAMALLPMTAAARGRVGVFVGPGFGYGLGYGYGWRGGWYNPYFYGPYGYGYGPYGYGFGYPNAGSVKLDTKLKDAEVFIDGSYAGTVGQLKTMTMRPGTYDIELRAAGRQPFEEKIYVTAGKTMKVTPDLPLQLTPDPGLSGDRSQ